MEKEKTVICGANSYEGKYYLNPAFNGMPQSVKDELKIMCVLFTEDIGGVFTLSFTEDGSLQMNTSADEGDLLYDEIGSVLKIKQLRREKRDLFEALEMYYRVYFLGEVPEDVDGD